MAVFSSCRVFAEQTGRVLRIGYLGGTDPRTTPAPVKAFSDGLREQGYIEGRNILIDYRWAQGVTQLGEQAAELTRLPVDVIVAWGTPAVAAAKRATTTIPIVMVSIADPVASGFVETLARPHGNITGTSTISPDTMPKLVELLTQAVPGIHRIAVLGNPDNPASALQFKQIEAAARSRNLSLQSLEARAPADFEGALASVRKEGVVGLVVLNDPLFVTHGQRIAGLAIKNLLPAAFGRREQAASGGLLSYGQSLSAHFHQAAVYAAKILGGTKVADLPVEQPTRFEMVINLKTAKALGIKIPQALLLRADEVIE